VPQMHGTAENRREATGGSLTVASSGHSRAAEVTRTARLPAGSLTWRNWASPHRVRPRDGAFMS